MDVWFYAHTDGDAGGAGHGETSCQGYTQSPAPYFEMWGWEPLGVGEPVGVGATWQGYGSVEFVHDANVLTAWGTVTIEYWTNATAPDQTISYVFEIVATKRFPWSADCDMQRDWGYGGTLRLWEAPSGSGLVPPIVAAVAPAAQTQVVGESAALTAHVTDENGAPVVGTPVLFTRSGSNPGNEIVDTNANGDATHVYRGDAAGADIVTVSAPEAGSVGAAVVVWQPDPAEPIATAVVFNPAVVDGVAGDTVDVAFHAVDQDGSPLPSSTVRYAVGPAGTSPQFDGSTSTDSDGNGSISVTAPYGRSLQVVAYADAGATSPSGTRDATELLGAALVDGTSPPDPLAANEPPELPTPTTPPDDAVLSRDDPQMFGLRTTDPNGEPWTGEITVTNVETGEATVFPTAVAPSGEAASGAPAPPLPPGIYTWTATANDARGAVSPVTPARGLTIEGNLPPSVPILVAPDHDHRFSLTDPQTFSVQATDPNGDPYSAAVTVRDAGTGGAVRTIPIPLTPSGEDTTGAAVPPLPPGLYTWSASASDAAGASSDESPARAFTVRNLPPAIPTLLSPKPAETFSTTGPQSFTLVATDPDGDAVTGTVTVRDAGSGAVVTTFPTSPAPSGEDSAGAPAVALPTGGYTWEATVDDAHGAPSDPSTLRAFSVSANRSPGVPVLVSPPPGAALHLEEPQVFTIAAEDPEGAPYRGTVTVTSLDTGAAVDVPTSAAPSGGQSSGTPTVPLLAGGYTWTATATDAFGVTGPASVSRSFTVEASPSPPPAAAPASGPTTRMSVSAAGAQGNDWSGFASISADGRYVAFESDATNLVPGDTNGREDVFVRDRIAGVTERVSMSSSAAQGNDRSMVPSISSDGRYVVFSSDATNLASGDTNGALDAFVHDRVTKATTRVSLSSLGAQGNGHSGGPAVSADGRYVAFYSAASNLVSGDTNTTWDIFVRDLTAGTTQRVSVSSSGAQGNDWSMVPSISADGRYVAFESWATNLASGDTNGLIDVFVRDLTVGTTQRVSVSSSGAQGNGLSKEGSISADGRYVAFQSGATTLVSGDAGPWDDVFVRDLSAGTTQRVSVSSLGVAGNRSSDLPSISADGRYVAFLSSAANLVAGDRNDHDDVFVRDRLIGGTTLVSHDPDGLQAHGESSYPWPPAISNDGLHVAFASFATNLVDGDTNGQQDIFAYNREASLDCAGGSLSAVGCLSGYGFKAASSKTGLEGFYPYHPFDLGSDTAYLNAATGNLVVQATDLEVPGQGLNLRLTRTYNSQSDHSIGPLGRGWRLGIADGDADDLLGSVVSAVLSTDVGQLLEVVATEDQFDFFDADGTRHHFIKGGLAGPGWHSPPGVNLTLTDYLVGAERRYRATRPDGVTYEFASVAGSYGLTSIADRKGNSLGFAYSSGRLSGITDQSGRTFTFAWSGDYLDSATFTAPGGTTTVDYTVDAASGRLTSVSMGGRTVSYTYRSPGAPQGAGLATVTDGRGRATTFAYDDAGMLESIQDRDGAFGRIYYNEPNSLNCPSASSDAAVVTCVREPGGPRTTYSSSSEGNLLSVRDDGDSAPNERRYLWDNNRLVWESDEAGSTTEYAYNDNGQVILTRESGGGDELVSVFTYRDVSPGVADLVSARIGVDTGDERVWRFGLAENGNLLSTTDPTGAVTSFRYHQRGLLKTVTDPNGATTTYGNTAAADGGYHGSGQPPSITDAAGATKSFSYNQLGRTTSVVDRNGNTWSFAYDARGNLTSQSAPGAGTATFAYDANDNLTATTPPGGATTTMTYDDRDSLRTSQATVDSVLRKTEYIYQGVLLKEILEPRSFAGSPPVTQKVAYEHYPNGRISAFIDEEGHRAAITYTPDGSIRTVTDPPGASGSHSTTYAYNRRGQVVSVLESGHSKPTTHAYSTHGERLSTTTPRGTVTHFAYDRMGRLTRITNADGGHSDRVYDRAGNFVRVTQPVGERGGHSSLTTSYSYTPRGEIATESDPADGAHVVEYVYDAEGRQTSRRDRYGGDVERTIAQTVSAAGQITERNATGAALPAHRSTFAYDLAGNLTGTDAFIDGAAVSSVSVAYNGAFEATSVSETLSPPTGIPVTKSVSYAYQPDGLLASRTADGLTTTYTNSVDGHEDAVTPWGGVGSFTYEHFDNGAMRRTVFPNGAVAEHLYDPADRLLSRIVRKSDGQTVLSSWTAIAYDDNDNRTSEAATQRQPDTSAVPVKSGNATHSYDTLDRLTSAKHPFDAQTATYELDAAGNVTRESGASPIATATYVKNRIYVRSATQSETEDGVTFRSTEAARYTHDHLGNVTKAQTTLTVVASAGHLSDTAMVSHVTDIGYDAGSHTKRVATSDGSYVDYAYDAFDRMVRRVEHPVSGADTVTLFFHDGTAEEVVAETDGAGIVSTRYILDSAGQPLGQEETSAGTGRSYYVDDPRGNLTQLIDQNQAVKAVFAYDPFGKEKPTHTTKVGSWDSRLRFQMTPNDPKTGAYAIGPRLYDPNINRFVGADMYVGAAANMDLAVDPLTGNRYLYAGANPTNMIDDGHGWCALGHRKKAKGSKKHPGCKGGSRHVKKAVNAVKRVVKTTVKVTKKPAKSVSTATSGLALATVFLPGVSQFFAGVSTASSWLGTAAECVDGGRFRNCLQSFAGSVGDTLTGGYGRGTFHAGRYILKAAWFLTEFIAGSAGDPGPSRARPCAPGMFPEMGGC